MTSKSKQSFQIFHRITLDISSLGELKLYAGKSSEFEKHFVHFFGTLTSESSPTLGSLRMGSIVDEIL